MKAGQLPDLRARARAAGEEQPRRRAPALHHQQRRGRGARRRHLHRRRHAPRRGRLRRPVSCIGVAATSASTSAEPKIIVDKSTVPVGTADRVRRGSPGADPRSPPFDVVSNPEFLKEGAAVDDFMQPRPDHHRHHRRTNPKTCAELYAPFCRNHDRILFMDVRSAELTKYAANAMLATRSLHERHGQPRRAARRRRRAGAPRHRLRPAHRPQLPLPRRRLRRLLLPQGREGADPRRPRGRARAAMLAAVEEVERRARRRCSSSKIKRALRGALTGSTHRRLGARLQTQHRRHARGRLAAS